jgi:predicted DNA binding protein
VSNGNYTKGNTGITQSVIPLTEITTETITKTTDRDHHLLEEIEQAQQETAATKEEKMVVEIKTIIDIISNSFQTEISNQEATRLVVQAKKHGKQIEIVIQQTKDHFLATNKPINDLVAALVHGIKIGWDKPKKSVVGKMPKAMTNKVEPDLTDEQFEAIKADSMSTLKFLRSTEKDILAGNS